MPTSGTNRIDGAPPARGASRLFLALVALLVFALPLTAQAESPVPRQETPLAKAGGLLKEGKAQALAEAAKALKTTPLGAAENLLTALCLFHAAQFDDAARYLRRAMAANPDVLASEPALSQRMPQADITARLNELAPKVVDDPELCFLAGAMVMLTGDKARALPLLVRAEELAGTDSHAGSLAARLAATPFSDRNRERATNALRAGGFDDAARCFAFAALDSPTVAEHYAGSALALALAGDMPVATRMLELAMARARYERLLPWLRDLRVSPQAAFKATAAARKPALASASLADLRVAAAAGLAGGLYQTCRDAILAALLRDKLDVFTHELIRFLDNQQLYRDPPGLAPPESDQPAQPDAPARPDEPVPAVDALEEARKLIRRLEFTEALKVLEPLVAREPKNPKPLLLVFVAYVGRVEPQPASDALESWFAMVPDADRTRLNQLRELFDRAEHFSQWRRILLTLREADPNAALPRLLNAFVELSAGGYAAARQETQVALIGAPDNEMLRQMARILAKDEFQRDASPPTVTDRPTAKTLLGQADALFRRGEYESARTELLKAQDTNPKEPRLSEALLRVYVALGDYQRAARQAESLLAEQNIAERNATDFSFSLEAGYDNRDAFNQHLAALQKAATERTSAADEYLLLGVIQFSRGQWKEATAALTEWKGLARDRKLNPALLKLLEAAGKKG